MKQVLSVQDLSCLGKCSLTVALPVISAMGCACSVLPTTLLSTHTAFPDPHRRSLTEDMDAICAHWQSIGARFDAVSVGYLCDPGQVSAVQRVLDAFPGLRVIDPVMGDHGKLYRSITAEHVAAMKQLCQKGTVLLPNLTEAALLTGLPYRENPTQQECGQLLGALAEFGAETVILTGVSRQEALGFVGSHRGEEFSFFAPRVPRQCHGTGDLFAAVVTGALVQGKTPVQAASLAARFVARVIEATPEATPFGVEFESQLPYLWQNL